MPQTRRNFLKNATILAGASGLGNMNISAIEKAFLIPAKKGTTFYDAEHIVFLMQENRSFDHIFGCMKGVRGYNDPRIKHLPDGDKAWIQKTKGGKAHAPFHLDIHKTQITWQGGLPHDWPDQSAARNDGKYDKWIPNKSAMTMGYYNREDMPFYYALADAFTICDHYFCSSLTGTTPNRLFFWTGNIRPQPNGNSIAAVRNSMAESRDNIYVDWETFPELLEDNDISWKVYQNELWTAKLNDDTDYWLGNYGDNPLEYIKRHKVKLSAFFRKNGDQTETPHLSADEILERYNRLSQREKNLIDKAFTTNIQLNDYLQLEPFHFTNSKGEKETVSIPKEDIFYEFRKDVESKQLPTVSWLVAPQSFSDHTSTPFYGTWYVSQALDILTKDPELWKKTIFIVNYDENDGYFDHIPPFVVPKNNSSGKVSTGIDIASDFDDVSKAPIGLGYRVPMIIASPWTRGGYVNSQVCDHTSMLMFLENFLNKKTGRQIVSPNISSWRRSICGDLTSMFRPYNGEQLPMPDFLNKEKVITDIQNAKTQPKSLVPKPLSEEEIKHINGAQDFINTSHPTMPLQEKGVKPACALSYNFNVATKINKATKQLDVLFNVEKKSQAVPFNMYTNGSYEGEEGKTWAYAVLAGSSVKESLYLDAFDNKRYSLHVHAPNGFLRSFLGDEKDPDIFIEVSNGKKRWGAKIPEQKIIFKIKNNSGHNINLVLKDNAYKKGERNFTVTANNSKTISIDLASSSGWYDVSITTDASDVFQQRFAGHVETGKESITDPFMGGIMS